MKEMMTRVAGDLGCSVHGMIHEPDLRWLEISTNVQVYELIQRRCLNSEQA